MIPRGEPDNLTLTDHRIAQLETSLMRQRMRLDRLALEGRSTAVAALVLEAGEAVLKSLEDYRRLLVALPRR